ncbi:hypothetical protein PACTADRAFT_23035, partial [Pachysolen tannophilus NRRL Y-2460]
IDSIIEDKVNLYELLELDGLNYRNITEKEVRRQFRKKALIYHPDKDPSIEARKKFELISIALNILVDPNLKSKYDNFLEKEKQQAGKDEKLSKELYDLKIELQKNEQFFKKNLFEKTQRLQKIERLKEDGLNKRKLKEKDLLFIRTNNDDNIDKGIENNDLPLRPNKNFQQVNTTTTSTRGTIPLIKLKWKRKPDLVDHINEETIIAIMSIFGKIDSVNLLTFNNKSENIRYDYCLIQYHDLSSVHAALNHDYSKTSNIWDNSGLRKLSSLLRNCEIYNDNDHKINKETNSLN